LIRVLIAVISALIVLALPAVASAAQLTIRANEESVTYEEHVQIAGELTGTDDLNDQLIELVALRYPYTDPLLTRRTTTSESGHYQFSVRPDFNTRYFVRTADGQVSGQVFVWVEPQPHFLMRVPRPGLAEVKLNLLWSKELAARELDRRRVYWYLAKRGQAYARRLPKRSHTHLVTAGQLLIRARVRLPGVPEGARFGLYFCFQHPNRDIGIFEPGSPDCPRNRKYLEPKERP